MQENWWAWGIVTLSNTKQMSSDRWSIEEKQPKTTEMWKGKGSEDEGQEDDGEEYNLSTPRTVITKHHNFTQQIMKKKTLKTQKRDLTSINRKTHHNRVVCCSRLRKGSVQKELNHVCGIAQGSRGRSRWTLLTSWFTAHIHYKEEKGKKKKKKGGFLWCVQIQYSALYISPCVAGPLLLFLYCMRFWSWLGRDNNSWRWFWCIKSVPCSFLLAHTLDWKVFLVVVICSFKHE